MIKVQNIHKRFGDLHVLRGIDLSIDSGEIVSVTGSSGAGKTTLLQIMGTLDRADEGQLLINGKDAFALKDKQLSVFRNQEIGFVFQFHHLLPEFTALENICIPAFIAGRNKKDAADEAMELLRMLNLSDRASHKPSAMSGGEQQRVAIARALINKPSIILADEPSGNLDAENSEELHQLFFKLREQLGQTFAIVTHDPVLADQADRKVKLANGQIIA